MAYNRFYESIRPIYDLVKDNEFTHLDVPAEYRKQLRGLESDGYLIRCGTKKVKRYNQNYLNIPQWRIARRYLDLLKEGDW